MPLCGFNEKMLKGLTAFLEGLVEHGLVYRGKLNGETLNQGIRRELSDMSRLKLEFSRIEDTPKRIITKGIVTFATGFYLLMRQKGLQNNPEEYKQNISEICEYFRQMDEKYYGDLDGDLKDMQKLVDFLNKCKI